MTRIWDSLSAKLGDHDAVGGAVFLQRIGAKKPTLVGHGAVIDRKPRGLVNFIVITTSKNKIL